MPGVSRARFSAIGLDGLAEHSPNEGSAAVVVKGVERAAAVLVGVEAVGVAALAGWQVLALVGGDSTSATSSIALLVLTLVGVFAVGAFSWAIATGQSWGRSGAIVTQLLVLAVALGAATGAYAHPLVGLALAIPALVVLAVLIAAVRQAARRREPDRA